MTREEVLKMYEVNNRGIITSPGKFEGEALYVPHFWELVTEGFSDTDENNDRVDCVIIYSEDIGQFPELNEKYYPHAYISLFEDDNGFVWEV